MKKFLLFSLLSLLFSLSEARAYTQTDVDNATYLASKGIITTQSTTAGYRLDTTITRAEVMGIALKIKGITLPNYQCKGYFSDTRDNNWICRAVELAADDGIISRTNTRARPQDSVTRAEALAIVMKVSGLKKEDIPGYHEGSEGVMSDAVIRWQGETISMAFMLGIIATKDYNYQVLPESNMNQYYFYPNRPATRAEVFTFAKNILGGKTTENFDEIKIEDDNIVLYRNGIKTSLTTDAKKYATTPCQVGDTFVAYSLIGQSGQITIIKMSFGLCDADGGSTYLFFQDGILENLVDKIQTKFGIRLSRITSVKIINQQVVINGYFTNNTCTDSPECSPGFSTNNPGIKVLSSPTNSSSGNYEWTGDISNF